MSRSNSIYFPSITENTPIDQRSIDSAMNHIPCVRVHQQWADHCFNSHREERHCFNPFIYRRCCVAYLLVKLVVRNLCTLFLDCNAHALMWFVLYNWRDNKCTQITPHIKTIELMDKNVWPLLEYSQMKPYLKHVFIRFGKVDKNDSIYRDI
jgi:hypothetical protein